MTKSIFDYLERKDIPAGHPIAIIWDECGRNVAEKLVLLFGGETIYFPQAKSLLPAIKRMLDECTHPQQIKDIKQSTSLSTKTITKYQQMKLSEVVESFKVNKLKTR